MFPAAGNFIYFAKDFILLGAYIGFLLHPGERRGFRVPENTQLLLVLVTVLVGLQVANSNSNSLLLTVIGIKPYLFYIPLLFLARAAFRTQAEFFWFLRLFLLIAVPVFLLGVFQFPQPPDSIWNKYARENEEGVATFGEGEFARITSTFSYIAGLTTYIIVVSSLVLPLLIFTRRGRWHNVFGAVVILAIGNTFMSGSRAPAFGLTFLLLGFLVGNLLSGSAVERAHAPRFVLVGILGLLAAVTLFARAAEAIKDRTIESAEEGQGRILSYFTEPWRYAPIAGAFGYGAGLTLGPTQALQSALHLPEPKESPPPLEVESSRVMVELGWPTFIAWHAFRIYLLVSLWKVRTRLHMPVLRQLALGAFLACAYFLANGIVVNHIAGLYNWFLVSFVYLLPKLDTDSGSFPLNTHRSASRRSRALFRRKREPIFAPGGVSPSSHPAT